MLSSNSRRPAQRLTLNQQASPASQQHSNARFEPNVCVVKQRLIGWWCYGASVGVGEQLVDQHPVHTGPYKQDRHHRATRFVGVARVGVGVGGTNNACCGVGLDNAGKTTLLFRLRTGEVHSFVPTQRAQNQHIRIGRLTLSAWDVGGTGVSSCYL
jgi:hypothetical protein